MRTPTIVVTDPRTDPRWWKLALGPLGSVFTSPPWIEAVCGTYGFTPHARIAVDAAGRTVGGFAWVPVRDLRGERVSSLPFSDRADPMVRDESTWKELVDGVITSGQPFTLRCFDSGVPASDPRFDTVGTAAWHGTPLDGTVQQIYGRLSGHARRNIGVAERRAVRVEASTGLEAVRHFHALHVQLRRRKYRLLAQPVELLDRIWEAFSADDGIVTLLAFAGDELIAGAVFLVWNDVLYYKFGASRQEHLALRPNDALFWAGIKLGIERGLGMLDWGLSDLDQPGLVAYKGKWATEERRIVTLRPAGGTPLDSQEADRVLSELTRLLTEETVPDEITARAGALLYRYFC